MPVAHINVAHIHYDVTSHGKAPVLVLSNSLATNFFMWDAQLPALSKHFRVLRYDTRGHGQSEVTPGPYSFDQLGRDVLALADAADVVPRQYSDQVRKLASVRRKMKKAGNLLGF